MGWWIDGRYGRARDPRPVVASVDTPGQQQRRSGIIAATCPAVRVRIIGSNPIPEVGIAGAKPTEGVRPASTGMDGAQLLEGDHRLFDLPMSVLHLMG